MATAAHTHTFAHVCVHVGRMDQHCRTHMQGQLGSAYACMQASMRAWVQHPLHGTHAAVCAAPRNNVMRRAPAAPSCTASPQHNHAPGPVHACAALRTR
eukprot:365416-Chlamydomonas_euryale.AAC.6